MPARKSRSARQGRKPTGPAGDRPQFTAGYGIEKELTKEMVPWNGAMRQIRKARNFWITTVSSGAKPHAMPVWGLWMDDAFYFSTDPQSVKARNMKVNPNIVVHLESGDDVIILEGQSERVTDPGVLKRFANLYYRKYKFRPDVNEPGFAFFKVRPHTAFAWFERNFPRSATRWVFDRSS